MPEKDILRIALIVLLLGFSLPGIFRIKIHGISKKDLPQKQENNAA